MSNLLPEEFIARTLDELKPGDGGFIWKHYVSVRDDRTVWIDEEATVVRQPDEDAKSHLWVEVALDGRLHLRVSTYKGSFEADHMRSVKGRRQVDELD